MNSPSNISVPRVWEVTPSKSKQDKSEEREWKKTRKFLLGENKKYVYGTEEAKEAWKRRIAKTRSV